ncbi:hypothetical protein LMG7974_00959 [Campylobacter majalis]|uniref:ATP-binding protein n=1 Tax=Campylobacter majalis TaxID=2790656 RepID=A0ABM8Q692_9BACT|nr:ATP-binding protein [Campylobacter majalis]CAD7288338.1 hypothetical protein LMG7974_00959 [Campylobacter majalis]
MQTLAQAYQTPLKHIKYISRKLSITSPKTLLVGASGTGKTAMICEYLSEFKDEERLYVDLHDMRFVLSEIGDIADFVKQNDIKAVAIDGVSSQNISLFAKHLQNVSNVVFSSEDKDCNLDDYACLNLNYLDYEEFILFFRKNLDETLLFSHFLAHGGAVASAFMDASLNASFLQNELRRKFSQVEILILIECADKISTNLSTYEIYKNLKLRLKISKDSVYNSLRALEKSGMIYLLKKYNESSSLKRVYFGNFALKNALSYKKEFVYTLKNAVFCELFKLKTDVFYTNEIDFYIPNKELGIITVPFSDVSITLLRFNKLLPMLKSYGIKRLQIISVSTQGASVKEGIKCEILPFYQWALSL